METLPAKKRCGKCGVLKSRVEFYPGRKNGSLRFSCIVCTNAENKQHREENKKSARCIRCSRKAATGVLCDRCKKMTNLSRVATQNARKLAGLCEVCGVFADGAALCMACNQAKSARGKKRYRLYKTACLCPGCGVAAEDNSRCDACLKRAADTKSTLYDSRVKSGKCGGCGEPVMQGKLRCRACWMKHAARRWAGGADAAESLESIWQAQRGLCALTGVELVQGEASLDHIVPRSMGGPDDCSNLRWVHRVVNVMRGNRTDEELVVWCRRVIAHASGKRKKRSPSDSGQLRLVK